MGSSSASPKAASPANKAADATRIARRPHVPQTAMHDAVRRLAGGAGGGGGTSVQRVLGPHLNELHGLIGNRAIARLMSRDAGRSDDARDDGGVPLRDDLRTRIEGLSGISMSDVRVHSDSRRPAALQAHAYTSGSHIHVAPGEERHLPHEAWHVVQQKQGRVQPMAGVRPAVNAPVNDDPSLEREADRMAARAASGGKADPAAAGLQVARPPRQDVIQGKWFRMSTRLDDEDEIEIAEIAAKAEAGEMFQAFWLVVQKSAELKDVFERLMALARRSSDMADAIDKILWETFDDPAKAYTAGEIVDLFDANPVIADSAGLLIQEDQDEIDALISDFGKLHIEAFRSDVDDGREEHYVYWGSDPTIDGPDVIVASNPKPLALVLAAKNWEGYPLNAALITQLEALRKTAKIALYTIGSNVKRGLKGSRTKANMDAFRLAMTAIAKVLRNLGGATHQATLLPPTDLSQSANTIEGTHVIARPLSINSATSGSKPRDGRLMDAIRKRAGPDSKHYMQMHLLNDLVYGPGELWNLTPGPRQSNIDMQADIEDPLKRAVLGKGLVINFDAEVDYNHDPTTASDTDIEHNPDKYRFQYIHFLADQLEYDKATQTWQSAAVQDVDVQKVDGAKLKWRYGSLEPLTPKPHIFDTKTTGKDLNAVGVQPAAAQRIVAFVNANPTWRPAPANKQKQLAAAVKKWDGESRVPNISSWKATAVYWSSGD